MSALPEVTPENEFFWRGGAEGELRLQRCGACDALVFPPSPRCRQCRSDAIGVVAVSGRAEVAAYTVNRHPWPGEPEPPYVLAIVELAEDARTRLTTRLVNVVPEDVAIGMAVQVTFDQVEDVWLPLFEPSR